MIKIDAKTVVANEGGFEPHPESYTPRVFAAVREREAKVYEILQNGQAIPWPCLPVLEGFDYWVLYVEHLSDVDMHRVPKKAGFGPSTQKAIDAAQAALRSQQDPVPQADGYSDSGTLLYGTSKSLKPNDYSLLYLPCYDCAATCSWHYDGKELLTLNCLCPCHTQNTRKSEIGPKPSWIGEDVKKYTGPGLAAMLDLIP